MVGGYRTIKDYVSASGENEVLAWLNDLPKQAKAKINAMIRRLEVLEDLKMPQVKPLHGPCSGLIELRIKGADNIQYRPLCCHGPGDKEVTILAGAIEKGGKFVPRSACSTAQVRMAEIVRGGRTCDHDFS